MSPASLLERGQPGYPSQLEHLQEPPERLWYHGRLEVLHRNPRVSIVGTRRATPAGMRASLKLARELSLAGVAVISGLARGIDYAAHRGALQGAAPTVAITACGLDRVYPAEHRELHAQIGEEGLLLSEFPPGTPPLPHHFLQRNRLVAALAQVILVVQAPKRSGALNTANWALQLGREVVACPGPVESEADAGNLQLLKDGAGLVTEARDILELLGLERVPSVPYFPKGFTW